MKLTFVFLVILTSYASLCLGHFAIMDALGMRISFLDILEDVSNLGMTTTDLLTAGLAFIGNMFAAFFYYYFAFTMRKPLEILVNQISELEFDLDIEGKFVKQQFNSDGNDYLFYLVCQNNSCKSKIVFATGTVVTAGCISMTILGFLDQDLNFSSYPLVKVIPVSIMWIFMNGVIFYLPAMIALIMLVIHLTGSLQNVMDVISDQIQANEVHFEKAVRIGTKVIDAFKALDQAFSRFLLAETVFQMWILMIGR